MHTIKRNTWMFLRLAFLVVIAIALTAPGVASRTIPAASAAPAQQAMGAYSVVFNVTSARDEPKALGGVGVLKGDPITEYKFQVNVDNTGDPFNKDGCDPALDTYPESCDLPSIRTVPAWSPVYTHGDEISGGVADMPAGKYLVSITADGYKIDGEHFSIPAPDPDGDGIAVIDVAMHPYPLPPATMIIKVFNDNAMTNGQHDGPSEEGNLPPGFRASLNDIAGEITTDIFGNPLCTSYEKNPATGEVLLDGEGAPIIETLGAGCYSDIDGNITIPNIGPLRYDVLVFPPVGQQWIQTTTLEGSNGWDTWLQEAGTGLDNEFLVAAEPFPWTIFGFVQPNDVNLGGTGSISGVIMAASTFVPASGGLPYIGDTFAGFSGTKLHRPIVEPWLSLNTLTDGDTAIWVGKGNADGSFNIPNVPEGNYLLTYWDEKQHYILDFVQVTVVEGQLADVGIRMLTGWFTEISGNVFHDYNENGRRDAGEPGIPNYLVVLKDRDNTEIDRMSIASATNGDGFYELEKGYPMGSWMVLEAYSDLYRTTGVTYQTLNMPEEETIMGGIVDVGILPVLGQPVRLDWGVMPYTQSETGGIAGTVFYDTVRAEDNARYAGIEPWQPGIPGLTVKLYRAQMDNYGNLISAPDGSALKGELLAVTETETYARPKGCTVRDVDGNPVDFPSIPSPEDGKDCLEGPLMGTQIGDGQNELDGNWGFSDGCLGDGGFDESTGACADGSDPVPLTAGNYLVEVVIPSDASTTPMFQVTREEDLNVFDGDEFEPLVPPPACAGPLHTVDIAGAGTDEYPELIYTDDYGTIITVPPSTPVENSNFAAAYNPRYEGEVMPLCNVKHVYLSWGKAVAPVFTLFTEVPIPGKWRGYIIDNLNVSVDPNTLFFGEMAGVPEVPIGLYDYSGRLVHTVHSDFNGVYEVLMPSTSTYNAPSPSGMFANVYYQYGNDPGPTGAPNEHYNPQYRSIGTSFEIYPGTTIPADLAPTQNGAAVWSPGSQYNTLNLCKLDDTDPQLFRVSEVYGPAGYSFTITGIGFGDAPGSVTIGDNDLVVTAWSNTQIDVTIPESIPPGAGQLLVHASNGLSTVNGLTFHVIGDTYNPTIYKVGLGEAYDPTNTALYDGAGRGPIQHAIDDAAVAGGPALVVVYPGSPSQMVNPQGWYLENLFMYAPVKLQGVGPGGILPDGSSVPGSVIDGRAVGGDSPYNVWWHANVGNIWNNLGGWSRSFEDQDGVLLFEGAVITVLANDGEFTQSYNTAIDGFIIQGGDQQGFPNNRNFIGGELIPGVTPNTVVQGGGIFANGYARYLQITNNKIQSNGGAFGGAIRLGTPHIPEPDTSNHNENILIAHNRILANGGTNLAGAIAVFAGADNYEIAHNDLCGNASIEYGGGISHYGFSPYGAIHHNRVYFNSSYDEGGGIMIAGELPADPTTLSPGAGPVDIHNNLIQSNLANDDGGGLRFLMAGGRFEDGEIIGDPFVFNVYNNIITNNVSTHEGGGISLNDAPYANIVNNTIMNNVTTATAMTSDGTAAPAGLSSSRNSDRMQGILPVEAPVFSDPVMFNNVFWGNRAGSFDGNSVTGLGLPGDTSPIFYWDLGVADNAGLLNPQNSVLQVDYPNGANNIVGVDPMVFSSYDTQIQIFPWRGNANFIGAHIVAVDASISLQGDYHITSYNSPAKNLGAPSAPDWFGAAIPAATVDIDDQARPGLNGYDAGADEFDLNFFPSTLVLDDFNRANGGLGINWAGDTQQQYYRIWDNQVQVRREGSVWYLGSTFGMNQEAFLTFTNISNTAPHQGLLLKLNNQAPASRNASFIKVTYNPNAGLVELRTKAVGTNSQGQILQATFPETFLANDVLGARAEVGGWVIIFKNGTPIGSYQITNWVPVPGPTNLGVTYFGVSNTNFGGFDNFGGGDVP